MLGLWGQGKTHSGSILLPFPPFLPQLPFPPFLPQLPFPPFLPQLPFPPFLESPRDLFFTLAIFRCQQGDFTDGQLFNQFAG